MNAYYNENDPKAAAWLRELIKEGHIATGVVDERSITEIKAHELSEFTQCHFFAGIGGWSYALRLAGWPDNKPVWTGSCPCQPLSCAGQRKGHADERHLWPDFYGLIAQCQPSVCFGEQVASPDGREWFSGVRADLEATGYACGAADLCAAGASAPHSRQRIYWMANSGSQRIRAARLGENEREARCVEGEETKRQRIRSDIGTDCGLVLANGAGWESGRQTGKGARHGRPAESAGGIEWMDYAHQRGSEMQDQQFLNGGQARGKRKTNFTRIGGASGFWDAYDICHFTGPDAGKTRRIESGTFPLAHGVSERMGLLRGYGNAIVPQVAAEFILASEEARLSLQTP